MDGGGEIDLKFALEVHGLHGRASSESESDHSSDFDEYEEFKPPPVEINSDNVIVIYPSDEENKTTDIADNNIDEGWAKETDQPVQNTINTAAFRKESLNPSTNQNDMNGNLPGMRPHFPNPNMQHFQLPIKNYYNPHAIGMVPVFPNSNNMQQFPQNVYNVPNPNTGIRPNMQQFQQPIQNYYNPHAIRVIPRFPNPNNIQQFPQTVQNYSNPNVERIRPDFSIPNNMQQPQTVQTDSNPNAERIRPYFPNTYNMQQPRTVRNVSNPNEAEFSNPSNMQQPQTVQNDSNPNEAEFSNPSNMQQPQTVQNDSNAERISRPDLPNPNNKWQPQTVPNNSNFNAERIRPYFPNPSSMQHFQNHNNPNAANFPHPSSVPQFYQTNQYIQSFNTGNTNVPILNNFMPNVTGMGYNPYQFNRPLSPMAGPPYGQLYPIYPPNQHLQHPNQFQGYTPIPIETKSNSFPKTIHMSPKTVDIMNMFREEDYLADIFDNNSKIVVSVEELVRAFVVVNFLKKSTNISVIKRFKIDCKPSEIISKVREQFNIIISELEINPESIVYLELISKINELLCDYHKECDTENNEYDIKISDDQSRDDCISNVFSFDATSSNTDEVEPTAITVPESSINFQQKSSTTVVQTKQIEGSYSQKFVSTTIKSVDGSTGTIPKKREERRAKRSRKFSKKGKTKNVYKPVIETYEELTSIEATQKLLLSVEQATVECEADIFKKNNEDKCEDYVYEDIYGWNYLDRSLLTDYTDSNNHESDQLLNVNRTTRRNNIHLSTASIKLENKRDPKNQRSRWTYLKYPIMVYLISGLTRSMLSWIVNNSIQICTFWFLWILKK